MSWLTAVEDPRTRPLRAWILDAGVLMIAALFAMPYVLHSHGAPHPRWLAVLGAALLVLPLAVRRIWPVPVFAAVICVALGFGAWDTTLSGNLALPVALYTVAAVGTRRQAYLCSAILEILVIAAAVKLTGSGLFIPVVFFTGMVAAAAGLGLYTATRRAYVRELVERAERLERERAQADELAAAAERARIAREMHDIVAHHLTVIVALSDAAARVAFSDPQQAADTMTTVSTVGRDALRDTRSLLGVLSEFHSESREKFDGESQGRFRKEDATERHPIPGIADLDALVDQVREAGLFVEFSVEGALPQLPTETQLAVYRLVQESLTNTMKHAAAGARASVSLRYDTDALRLRIYDDGAGQKALTQWRPGRGTSGMHARIHALGGHLDTGPHPVSGWWADAVLPLQSPAVSGDTRSGGVSSSEVESGSA